MSIIYDGVICKNPIVDLQYRQRIHICIAALAALENRFYFCQYLYLETMFSKISNINQILVQKRKLVALVSLYFYNICRCTAVKTHQCHSTVPFLYFCCQKFNFKLIIIVNNIDSIYFVLLKSE